MCAIVGFLALDIKRPDAALVNSNLNEIFDRSIARGRDGFGYRLKTPRSPAIVSKYAGETCRWPGATFAYLDIHPGFVSMIGNLRAEPTTEYVKTKTLEDQQPYSAGRWTIVHNGTIANDHELRDYSLETKIDSAAIVELLKNSSEDCRLLSEAKAAFVKVINRLKGSYAILATNESHPGVIFAACNYRPIWYAKVNNFFYFASARIFFPSDMTPKALDQYSVWAFHADGGCERLDDGFEINKRALVICSGGLDSTVAATYMVRHGYDVELLHFLYGSRAEGPEVKAVKAVAEALGVPYRLFPIPIYKPEDSPLLRADSGIAGGEAGAEFAHEWVPARNLVMLSVATALAEAGGFNTIVLGNNLEEAGAYPDNEPEFIDRFNEVLPFAVADGKRVRVTMPVGNMMKHEIVALGLKIKAPLAHTWSCYRAGELHCGTCGPCYMRRKAFEINYSDEVIQYEKDC